MLDISEAAQRARGRTEVLGGAVRRRRWAAVEKGRIVAEAVAPGAVIAQVARRHDMTPQHLSNWIGAAKQGRLALPADDGVGFVPVVAEHGGTHPVAGRSAIEIVAGSVVVRVHNGADVRTVEAVLRVPAGR